MKLLLDTDAFCKLAASNLLHDAAQALGAVLNDCGRLPALPHMLRRGSLPRRYGENGCAAMLQIAVTIPSVPQPSDDWLDPLAQVLAIDPGEALIFAVAAESGAMIVSSDKRALGALKDLEAYREALAGRIVVLEALLLELCRKLGADVVRQRVRPLVELDRVVRICFSAESDPEEGLRSYCRDLQRMVSPLTLWDPQAGAQR
jgi:hypothetical protein